MNKCIAGIFAAAAFVAGTQAQVQVVYNTSANWSSKTVADGDTVVINNNATVNLDQNDTMAILRVGNQASPANATLAIHQNHSLNVTSFMQLGTSTGSGIVTQSAGGVVTAQVIVNHSGTGDLSRYDLSGGAVSASTGVTVNNAGLLSISGGALTAAALTVNSGGTASLAGGTLNMNGTLTANGSVTVKGGTVARNLAGTTTTIAGSGVVNMLSGSYALTGGAATDVVQINTALFEISGGNVDLMGQVRVGAGAEFRVVGDGATIDVLRLNNQSIQTGTFRFVFGEEGVSTINSAGYINLSAATIAVDGSAYAGGAGTFDLFAGTTLSGLADVGNITITGFDGYDDAFVTQDADSGVVRLTVIPEPATLGLVMCVATGLLVVRRFRL